MKDKWTKWKIWNREWGVLPAMLWKHGHSLGELLGEELGDENPSVQEGVWSAGSGAGEAASRPPFDSSLADGSKITPRGAQPGQSLFGTAPRGQGLFGDPAVKGDAGAPSPGTRHPSPGENGLNIPSSRKGPGQGAWKPTRKCRAQSLSLNRRDDTFERRGPIRRRAPSVRLSRRLVPLGHFRRSRSSKFMGELATDGRNGFGTSLGGQLSSSAPGIPSSPAGFSAVSPRRTIRPYPWLQE